MAYFVKKVSRNNKIYLSIVDSFYDGSRRQTVHKTYASYGTGEKLKEELGIDDPIAYLQSEVKRLNDERNEQKLLDQVGDKEISGTSPIVYAGHFFLKAILDKLGVKPYLDIYDETTNFDFNLFDVLSSLVYARCIKPCSKHKTFTDVLPHLDEKADFSYDQLLAGLGWLGERYENIIEIFTKLTNKKYGLDTRVNYFDCTNFYFEIDKEDEDFRKKGPSKEKRTDPILGMGLLLDANQIPIGMKLYPGNQSEKPVIREIIKDLKEKNGIDKRIVQVADKGLNCAQNIYEALKNGDGYIFSKSCKRLPETEKVWVLLNNDYVDVKNSDGEVAYKIKGCVDTFPYMFTLENGETKKFTVKEKRVVTFNPSLAKKQLSEIEKLERKAKGLCLSKAKKDEYGECSKYVDFKGKAGEKAVATINQDKINEDKKMCGYNMLVTSEIKAKKEDIYRIYHNLWRIEESFRMMKSELDARPVYLQKKETISGHFLICYLSVLLIRLMQIKELKDENSYQEICNLLKTFNMVKFDNNLVSLYENLSFARQLKAMTGEPVSNAVFTEKQFKKMMSHKLK